MSEYEIFNDEEEAKPEPAKKIKILPAKKEKALEKKRKECKFFNFIKQAFGLKYLSLSISVISIFFSLFVGFIPLVSATAGALATVAAFFFIAFSCSFAGLIIEMVGMIKNKKVELNVALLFVLISFVIICLVLPSPFVLMGLGI